MRSASIEIPFPMPLSETDVALAANRIPPPKRKRPPLTPGRVVYLLYHYPKHVWRDGFEWHYHLWKGRREMSARLAALPAPSSPAGRPIQLHYLTGKRYLPLTTIASLSAQHATQRPVEPWLFDDGSLDAGDAASFKRLFPAARIIFKPEIDAQLDAVIPEERYPFLRRLRLGYIHLRKLTDIQTHGPGWRLVLDSDVFFSRRPTQLIELMAQSKWCHMQDCGPAYGAPLETLHTLADAPVHPRANVGICHVDAGAIDWDFVEHCARVLLHRHGFSYYLEQALMAILMARANAVALDADYLVYPTPEQARAATHVALHYVDKSHLTMMRYGWRQVLERL